MKRNKISDVFPIMLFMIFALSALGIVLASVQIYQRIVRYAHEDFETDTAVAYVMEKTRSHDAEGSIRTGDINGHDALILEDRIMDTDYITCIYTSDGYLRELYTEKELLDDLSEDSGTKILEMDELSAESISDSLIYLKFTDRSGKVEDTYIAVRSGGGVNES